MFRIAILALSTILWGALGARIAAADEPRRDEPRRPEQAQPQSRGPAPARPANVPAPTRPTYAPAPARPVGPVLDSRYNHGYYYPSRGSVMPALPSGYRAYYRSGQPYYFNGGVWYAPRGGGFVVIAPPVGVVISVLPPYYSTLWFGGIPYYYANNVYYTQQPDQSGYAVVDPPDGADAPSTPPDSGQQDPQQDLIVYPKSGQSKEQQAADQYECNNWAKGQTGFDPTQPDGAAGNSPANRNNYDRAMSACLTARGYQVN
jgi:hypothetical protein